MKTLNHFIDFVDLKYNKIEKEYQHRPFYMSVLNKDNKYELHCFLDAESVEQVYTAFLLAWSKKAIKIYFSIDFPPVLDSQKDFILITAFENNNYSFYAIPYDKETGKKFEIIKRGDFIRILKLQFFTFMKIKTRHIVYNN